MRILSIDYGTVRVGLALSDELRITVSPYKVLLCSDELAGQVAQVVRDENVGTVVLGVPSVADGAVTELTKKIRAFGEELRKEVGCEVVEWDESYSSRRAVGKMIDAGIPKSKRRKKETTDMWAAALILQDYLDSLR